MQSSSSSSPALWRTRHGYPSLPLLGLLYHIFLLPFLLLLFLLFFPPPPSPSSFIIPSPRAPVKKEMRAGITGIQKNMSKKNQQDGANISKAFQDLEVLMEMAKPMVALARNISSKIRDKQGNITEDETVQFKSYLLR